MSSECNQKPLIPNHQNTSDLMSRLQSFLPQMKAANQALETEEISRVDVDLEEHESASDSSDDENDEVENHMSSNVRAAKKIKKSDEDQDEPNQTIQIQFALTDPSNPMLDLLGNKDGEANKSEGSDHEDDTLETPATDGRTVKSLLMEPSTNSGTALLDIKTNGTKPGVKKSLITEL